MIPNYFFFSLHNFSGAPSEVFLAILRFRGYIPRKISYLLSFIGMEQLEQSQLIWEL